MLIERLGVCLKNSNKFECLIKMLSDLQKFSGVSGTRGRVKLPRNAYITENILTASFFLISETAITGISFY